MNILYIIKFDHDPLIAIGSCFKGSLEWLAPLLKGYKVSLKDSYLISADQRQTITKLEATIFQAYGHYKPSKRQLKKYSAQNSFTGILRWECSDAIVEAIQMERKDEKLGIGIVRMDEMIR